MNRVIQILDWLRFGQLFLLLSVSLNFLAEKISSYQGQSANFFLENQI